MNDSQHASMIKVLAEAFDVNAHRSTHADEAAREIDRALKRAGYVIVPRRRPHRDRTARIQGGV